MKQFRKPWHVKNIILSAVFLTILTHKVYGTDFYTPHFRPDDRIMMPMPPGRPPMGVQPPDINSWEMSRDMPEGYPPPGVVIVVYEPGPVPLPAGYVEENGWEYREYTVPPPHCQEVRQNVSLTRQEEFDQETHYFSTRQLTTSRTDGKVSYNTPSNNLVEIIQSCSRKHGLDAALIAAVIKAESNFNPHAVSPAGAQGLMQLMPGTARSLGVTNSFDPVQNINAGTHYLAKQFAEFDDNVRLALAAYNAGPKAVKQYGGMPPYRETREFVNRVLGYYRQYSRG